VRDPHDPVFDKIAKIWPLLEHFVLKSQALYNLEKEVTIDELIIAYKDKYCSLHQFMPNKPTRFGLKLWCLASSKSQYVYDVKVYEGKGIGKGPNRLGYTVCTKFCQSSTIGGIYWFVITSFLHPDYSMI
jgi:hypothetical protein